MINWPTVISPVAMLLALTVQAQAGSQPAPPELPRVEAPLTAAPESEKDDKLRPVPFDAPPKTVKRHRRIRTTVADLRDPFVKPSRLSKKYRKGVTALLLPDLKDPFRATTRVQPKNWKVPRVPGDIRDPFSPALRKRIRKVPLGDCRPKQTDDGVVIQRPSALKKPKSDKKKSSNCVQMVPKDLRDPFAVR